MLNGVIHVSFQRNCLHRHILEISSVSVSTIKYQNICLDALENIQSVCVQPSSNLQGKKKKIIQISIKIF